MEENTHNLKLNLDKKDYDFERYYLEKYNIPEGYGNGNKLLLIINEYKHFIKKEKANLKNDRY